MSRQRGPLYCEKTEDRTETKVSYGEKVDVPGYGRCQFVDIKEEKVPGKEKTVSESVSYPSSVPIKRYVDRSQGGTFTVNGFTPGAMQLSGIFKSAVGAHGGVSLSVELYGDAKDFPDTKEKINQMESEAKKAQEALNSAKRDGVSEEDIHASEDNLRKIELEKISAVGNHERTKALCDMQIKFSEEQLRKVQDKFEELSKLRDPEFKKLASVGVQLDVNKDLFDRLQEIIKVLDLKSEVIDNFMQLWKS